MSYDEGEVRWSRPFVVVFALVAIASLCALPFVSAGLWLAVAGGAFALLEAIGLRRHGDALPPLTFISRRYLPRWATVTIVGFFVGLAGGVWLGFAHPWAIAALLALYSWAESHFDVTYDSEGGTDGPGEP